MRRVCLPALAAEREGGSAITIGTNSQYIFRVQMGGREQCLHARSKVRVPDIHPSGHTMKVAWRPTLARAIILVLLVVARVPASWHMRHLGHTDDVGRVNADKVKSGVVDDFSEVRGD